MQESIWKINRLIEAAKDPEYRFLLIEPVLSYGIAFGLLLFVVAFIVKHSKLQAAGLSLTAASALCFMPYMGARRAALPRIEQIYRLDTSARGKLFMENTILWSASTWLYTALVILAVATFIVGSRRNQLGYGLSIGTALLGFLAIQNSLWLHYQDASAVHPNLRAHRAPIQTSESPNELRTSRRIPKSADSRETIYTAPVAIPRETPQKRFTRPIN